MQYDQFISEITESDANQWLYDDDHGIYTYKLNIAITIHNDREFENGPYSEELVEKLPG